MNAELKEATINNYLEYLEGEDLEDTPENVDLYISTLWYDLIDEIEINREMFRINKNIDDYIYDTYTLDAIYARASQAERLKNNE